MCSSDLRDKGQPPEGSGGFFRQNYPRVLAAPALSVLESANVGRPQIRAYPHRKWTIRNSISHFSPQLSGVPAANPPTNTDCA